MTFNLFIRVVAQWNARLAIKCMYTCYLIHSLFIRRDLIVESNYICTLKYTGYNYVSMHRTVILRLVNVKAQK